MPPVNSLGDSHVSFHRRAGSEQPTSIVLAGIQLPEDVEDELASKQTPVVLHRFETARAAEEFVVDNVVGIVITNCILPDLDGREFLRRLRTNPRSSKTIIVVAAPVSAPSLQDELCQLGADEVFFAPLGTHSLLLLVLRHLKRLQKGEHNTLLNETASAERLQDRYTFSRAFADTIREIRNGDTPVWLGKIRLEIPWEFLDPRDPAMRHGIVRKSSRLILSELGDHAVVGNWNSEELVFLVEQRNGNELQFRFDRLLHTLGAQPYGTNLEHPIQIKHCCALIPLGGEDQLASTLVRVDRLLADHKRFESDSVILSDAEYHPPVRRLLLILPDDLLPEFIREALIKDGFEIEHKTTVIDGASVLTEDNDFDLIVVDSSLPAPEDVSCVQLLRTAATGTNPSILAVLGEGSMTEMVRAFKSGARDYLTKPFSATDLLGRIYFLLKKQEPTMENSDHLIQIPAGTFVDAVARAVRGALLAGEDVAIPGLGNFNVLYEESRLDQDGTGEDVLLPPRNTVSFEPESVS